ncbi:VOC family protein [Nocardia sp. NPDC004068]|uniref:VOC family protein n=1 Tax=Nocardia sp. NPDC004068 TaxID=3364303 RepID=UPI0036AED1FA
MLTTKYIAGVPNWLDLGSPDPDTAATFYREVFGWDTRDADPGGYTYFTHDDAIVAALGPLTEDDADPAWTVYFHTDDPDGIATAAEHADGEIRLAPTDLPGGGRIAALTDPQGARFAVLRPADDHGGLDKVGAPAALCWVQLSSCDAAAFAFYRDVFEWRTEAFEVPGTSYTLLAPADSDPKQAAFGHEQLAQGEPAHWLPYFWVEDVDTTLTTIEHHGGTILRPATDAAYLGPIAIAADPSGARFALTTPKPVRD